MKVGRKSKSEYRYKKQQARRKGVHLDKPDEAEARPRANAKGKITGRAGIQRDIPKRKRAEARLRINEERLKYALAGANDGLWDWNVQTGEAYFSPRWKAMIGYTEAELPNTYETWASRLHPDDKLRVSQMLQEHFADTRRNYEPEFRMRTKAGEWLWIQARGRVVEQDYEGRPLRMVGTHTDITERKRTEEALRQSETRYRLVSKATNDVIWEWDIETDDLIWSENAQSIFGYSPEEISSYKTWWDDRIHPQDCQRVLLDLDTLIERREINWADEYRFLCKDGSYIYIVDRGYVEYDDSGKPLRMIGAMRDITRRKQAEEQLRASEQQLVSIYNNLEDSIFRLVVEPGERYRFEFVNKAFLKVTGLSREQVVGREAHEVIPSPSLSLVLGNYRQAIKQNVAIHWEETSNYPTGQLTGEVTIIPVFDAEGNCTHLVGSVHDITERKRAEEERRQLEARMQQAQKLESLGILAGGIAHDFNNLLTSMLGNAGLALLELPEESAATPLLWEIEEAAQRAADLTRQLLAYSGRGKFVIQVVRLDELVQEMTKLLETVVSKKATLHLELALATIEADVTQIRQVVMNLITNASDALEGQPGVISIRTGVRHVDASLFHSPYLQEELPAGSYAYVEVEDNGCGMTEETLARIFDPFFTTKVTGHGLGLAAVIGIAKGHKGTIKVTSAPGQGTIFQVLFPCAHATPSEASVAIPRGRTQRGHGTVLVVEDEESIRLFVRRALESAGFQVREAANGQEGLDLLNKHAQEIVVMLLDLIMPHMDGQEVLQQLRRLAPNLPVLIMSGYNDMEVSVRFAGMNANGFIQKPFTGQELITQVGQLAPSKVAIEGRQ